MRGRGQRAPRLGALSGAPRRATSPVPGRDGVRGHGAAGDGFDLNRLQACLGGALVGAIRISLALTEAGEGR